MLRESKREVIFQIGFDQPINGGGAAFVVCGESPYYKQLEDYAWDFDKFESDDIYIRKVFRTKSKPKTGTN